MEKIDNNNNENDNTEINDPNISFMLDMIHETKELDLSHITLEDIPNLILKIMRISEDLEDENEGTILTGSQKKDLVIKTIVFLLDESDITGSLEPILLPMLPTMIDNLIDVDKGNIIISRKIRDRMNIFSENGDTYITFKQFMKSVFFGYLGMMITKEAYEYYCNYFYQDTK